MSGYHSIPGIHGDIFWLSILELELQRQWATIWVLGTENRTFARAISTGNHRTFSLAFIPDFKKDCQGLDVALWESTHLSRTSLWVQAPFLQKEKKHMEGARVRGWSGEMNSRSQSTYSSCRGCRLVSQYLHVRSQLSVTLVLRVLMAFLASMDMAYTWYLSIYLSIIYIYMHDGKTHHKYKCKRLSLLSVLLAIDFCSFSSD